MRHLLVSALLYTAANAIGLFLAIILLPGFSIDILSFVTATLLFTAIEVIARPLIVKISVKSVPALSGGVALVTTLAGLFITSSILEGMEIGGIANLLAATLIVWLGALIAGLILPFIAFKKALKNNQE